MAITSSTLWKRSFRLTIGDREFGSVDALRPLEFSFSVQRDKTLTPNNANILIYNLAEDTRAHLEELSGGFGQGTGRVSRTHVHSDKPQKHATKKKTPGVAQASEEFGVTVRLEVGYGENLGQIFFGVLRKVSSWRAGPNWLTQISGGDAEHSIATAKLSKTFVKGTPIASVVKELVQALPGVGAGSLTNTLAALQTTGYLNGGTKLQRALTVHGDAATALEQLMRSCGFEWHISDGAFYAAPVGEPTLQGDGPLLTPETGLLDVPQIDKNGKLIAKALLNPDLLPGRVFRVESSRVKGNFLAQKTQHKGDTTGRDWTVEVVGSPPEKGSRAAALAAALGDTGFPAEGA
jgi:hypothetical protein